MRTTLTLEESVTEGLKQLQRENPEKSFKEIVNDLIKKGLHISGINTEKNKKFVIKPSETATPRPEFNFDNIGRLVELVEGESYK